MLDVVNLVSVINFRAQIGCSHGKAYAMLREGEIPSMKIGKLRRIPQDAIDAYLAARTMSGWTANA